MKKDIIDYQGIKIGELELPDNKSEDIWNAILTSYTIAPVNVIPDVTPRQIRQALVLSQISMIDVENALDSLDEPIKSLAKIDWEYSTVFQRSSPLVSSVGSLLGWTPEQLDNLWLFAGTL